MGARRPRKDSMFPMNPVPSSGGNLVPYVPQAPSEESWMKSSESRDLAKGVVTFFFESNFENSHDRRIFQIEEKDGKWKVASAWQAEGKGRLPMAIRVFRQNPDIFNQAANGLLYRFDSIIDRMVQFSNNVLSMLLPYDGDDVE